MRKQIARASIALIFASLFPLTALAAPTYSLVGLGDFSSPTGAGNTDTKIGYGGGLLVDLPMNYWWSLEVGGLYVQRKTDFTDSSATGESDGIEIPVLLRYHFNRYFSLGAGGYYNHAVGNYTLTSDTTGASSSSSYSDSSLSNYDFGLAAGAAIHVPLTSRIDFMADGRYTYGLTNVDETSGNSLKYRDIQVLLGFTFRLMDARF
jgi:hypothetical protein